MSNWQDWLVILVLILSFGWVAYKIYQFIGRTKRNESPCDSCATGCSVRDMVKNVEAQKQGCPSENEKNVDEIVDKKN